MRIYLTGFMGCGKSYTGRRLAKLIGCDFVDLDDWIEIAAGQSINEIFATQGEDAFREWERSSLRQLAEKTSFVMATGGGAPCYHSNMDWMNEHGTTVFLDPPLDWMLERLEKGRDHRPLLQTGEELADFVSQKLADRRPIYEKAHIQLQPTDPKTHIPRLLYDQLLSST